ncbi:MAG: hypothetical protein ACJA1A_001716 [Saprospiraceae bacterium]|jgi:hypothetical protein
MSIKRFLQLILILVAPILCPYDSSSQSNDTIKSNRLTHNILPIAFYLPETGFALGGTGILTFRSGDNKSNTRPSQVLYSAAYTFKNQLLLFVPFDIFTSDENYRIKGELGYYRYFYNFYGIGPDAALAAKETYDVNFPRLNLIALKKFATNLFIGAGYRFDNFDIKQLAAGGILESNDLNGKSGGYISNALFSIIYDNRDHLFDPNKGFTQKLALIYHHHRWVLAMITVDIMLTFDIIFPSKKVGYWLANYLDHL